MAGTQAFGVTRRVLLGTITAGALAGCVNQPRDGVPTLVAALPLTGDLAFLGTPGRAALEVAAKDAGAAGFPFRVSLTDTKGAASETATIVRRELDVNGSRFFLVTLSGPSVAARDALAESQALMLSVAIDPAIVAPGHRIVRFCPNAAQEGGMLVDRLRASPGTLAVVASRDSATTYEVQKVILPGLAAAGKPPTWTEWFDVGQLDFKILAARFQEKPTDTVLLLGYGSDFVNALSALAVGGLHQRLTVVGGIGFVELEHVPAPYKPEQFKFLAPAFSLGLGGASATAFRKKFSSATGKTAPYDAAYTYDAAMAFAQHYHQGATTPETMAATFQGRSYDGVTGRLTWDPTGEATTDIRWGQFTSDGQTAVAPT